MSLKTKYPKISISSMNGDPGMVFFNFTKTKMLRGKGVSMSVCVCVCGGGG